MKFDSYGTPKINFVEDLFKRVTDTYLQHLSNKMYFKMKLSCLMVKIYEVETKTDGSFWNDVDNNELKVILSVNPNDSKKYIAFIIAHEIAHLLMCSVSDALVVSRKISAIIRVNENGVSYGDQLEELLADYLAHFIVSKMDIEDENGQYAIHKHFCADKIKLISELESYFGESLMDMEHIDYEVVKNEKNIPCILSEYEEEEPQYSANLLWYSVANDSFDKVIEIYNQTLSAIERVESVNYFERLCNQIDDIVFNDSQPGQMQEALNSFALGFGS